MYLIPHKACWDYIIFSGLRRFLALTGFLRFHSMVLESLLPLHDLQSLLLSKQGA